MPPSQPPPPFSPTRRRDHPSNTYYGDPGREELGYPQGLQKRGTISPAQGSQRRSASEERAADRCAEHKARYLRGFEAFDDGNAIEAGHAHMKGAEFGNAGWWKSDGPPPQDGNAYQFHRRMARN